MTTTCGKLLYSFPVLKGNKFKVGDIFVLYGTILPFVRDHQLCEKLLIIFYFGVISQIFIKRFD